MLTAILLASLTTALVAPAESDYGDHRSETLTTKAWNALGAGQHDDALAYVAKCIELYETKAREMQASLQELPTGGQEEVSSKCWALNDVGTCLFIKGEVLLKKKDNKGALAAYSKLVKEFKFAQCWDPKGWFWQPATAAKQKVVELSFDEE